MWNILLNSTVKHRCYDYHLSLQITKMWFCPLVSNSFETEFQKNIWKLLLIRKCLFKILCYVIWYLIHQFNSNTLQRAYLMDYRKTTDVYRCLRIGGKGSGQETMRTQLNTVALFLLYPSPAVYRVLEEKQQQQNFSRDLGQVFWSLLHIPVSTGSNQKNSRDKQKARCHEVTLLGDTNHEKTPLHWIFLTANF